MARKRKAGKHMPKVLGLFSGAGGLDLGFSLAGFDVRVSIDIESHCINTLELNKGTYFSENHVALRADVSTLKVEDIPCNNFDFIIGGPPCQSFSAAGRRAGGVYGVQDLRGSLFWHYCRLIRELAPKGFLFENVRGLLQAAKGKDWEIIRKEFEALGYSIHYRVLDAADYGVPQHRERLIVVGLKQGSFCFPRPTHGPDSKSKQSFIGVGEALADIDNPNEIVQLYGGKYGHLLPQIPPGMNYLFFTDEMQHPNPQFAWRSKFSSFLYKVDPRLPSRTLVASPSKFSGPFHWRNRKFTIEEIRRIQTIPDDYKLFGPPGLQAKQIGNSVAPLFAQMLAKAIMVQMFDPKAFSIELIDPDTKLSFDKRKTEKAKRTRTKACHAVRNSSQPDLFSDIDSETATPTRDLSVCDEWSYESPRKRRNEHGGICSYGSFTVQGKLQESAWKIAVTKNNCIFSQSLTIRLDFHSPVASTFNTIECSIESDSMWDVCVAWDAIHHAVSSGSSYPNIQPLYGHFTEPYPRFKLSIVSASGNSGLAKFLKAVCEYGYLAKNHPLTDLVEIFGGKASPEERVKELRAHGFDVRVHETNRTIPKGHFRVCYPFVIPLNNPIFVPWKEVGTHETADRSSIPD